MVVVRNILLCLVGALGSAELLAAEESLVERLRIAADEILEKAQISYVYGGATVGNAQQCAACNQCIESESPKSKRQLNTCPECAQCGLDCSHFVQLLFKRSGVLYPYMETRAMLEYPADRLYRRYGFHDLGREVERVRPGDLAVYKGHVVLVERIHSENLADIVHATGGKDIKGPGQGIQRERRVPLSRFRGPLLRILRHKSLYKAGNTGLRPLTTRNQP